MMQNKNGWEIKKLKDLGQIVTGNTPKTSNKENYSSNDFCFFKPSDLRGETISILSTSQNYITKLAFERSRALPIGSVLVTCIGTIGNVGVTTVVSTSNQQINAIIPNEKVDSKFLAYTLSSLRSYLNGIANAPIVPIINKTQFSEVSVFLPPLSTQQQIVSELDALSDIINKKKQQLAALDQLAQATFYDMFGDPVNNEKGWEVNIINNIAKIRIGPFGSLLHVEDYVTNGTPLVNPSHMLNGKIIPDYNLTVDSEKIKELSSYLLQEGDLIVGRRGEIGRCALVSSNENGYICGTGSMYVRFNSVINPLFALKTFSSKSMVAKLLEKAKGATMLNINAGSVGSLFFPIPPISLQNQFITKIESIEKQKSLINQSIAEVQQLFDFTMDKYFN